MKKPLKYLCVVVLIMCMMSTSISFADPAPTAPVVYVALDGNGDFNCDGGDENGVGDDQVEIQQAIDYVLANDGFTTIRLKAGTYYINDTIYIAGKKDQKVILEGEEGTVLKLSTDVCWPKSQAMIQQKTTDMLADLPDAYLGNIIIRGFTMDGNGYNVTRALNTDGSERKLEYPNHNGISYYTLIFFRGCEDVEICNM